MSDAMAKLDTEMEKLIRPLISTAVPRPPYLPPRSTDDLLSERAKTHGDFADHAQITQDLKSVMMLKYTQNHNNIMRESMDMIAHKIGRILAGDPDFRDHWDDIAGYAKLVADRCTK